MVHFIFKHHAQLLILCLQGLGVHINYNALECCASTYLLSVLPNHSFRRLAQSPAELRGFVSLCSPLALEFKCFPALMIELIEVDFDWILLKSTLSKLQSWTNVLGLPWSFDWFHKALFFHDQNELWISIQGLIDFGEKIGIASLTARNLKLHQKMFEVS